MEEFNPLAWGLPPDRTIWIDYNPHPFRNRELNVFRATEEIPGVKSATGGESFYSGFVIRMQFQLPYIVTQSDDVLNARLLDQNKVLITTTVSHLHLFFPLYY